MAATPYLTADDILDDPSLARLSTLAPTVIERYITDFEETAEAYLDVAYTPREATVSMPIMRTTNEVRLPHSQIRDIQTLAVNTVDIVSDLYRLDTTSGLIRFRYGYRLDVDDEVAVTYDHGYDAPPSRLLTACRRYTVNEASSDATGTSRNIIGQSVDGSYIRYSTPDWNAGRPTGWLNVDVVLNGLRGDKPILVA